MQSPCSQNRNSPGRHSSNFSEENGGKTEELRRRRQRRRRRRPISSNDNDCSPLSPSILSHEADDKYWASIPSSTISLMDDPFHVIAMAVNYDENKRNAIEILQVPLETGKLYHNEKEFFQALFHLEKEFRSFRIGWRSFGIGWPVTLPSSQSWRKGYGESDQHETTVNSETNNQQPQQEDKSKPADTRQSSPRSDAITPIILSGILATLDDPDFSARQHCTFRVTRDRDNQDSTPTPRVAKKANSTELVNFTLGCRRAALTRVRLKMKRERTHRIVKPVLVVVTVICLYYHAWSSLQRLLVGFYGVTNIVLDPPEIGSGDPIERQVDLLRLTTSSCRSRINREHYGYVSYYAKACRIAEAKSFELLISSHNSRHTKLFARTAYDEVDVDPVQNTHDSLSAIESRTKMSAALTQYDDDYGDDTELPFYAMHTTLSDTESSIIPLENVIHNRPKEREKLQKQRWRRRRRQQWKYAQEQQRADEMDSDEIAAIHARLSQTVQFWGDTTVNYLVREAIIEAQYNDSYELPSARSHKVRKGSNISDNGNKLNLLDVGSGLSGTLFSLCTPEFPFEEWSYHGITISQPEVRRAKQLVETVIRPIIKSASIAKPSMIAENGTNVDSLDGGLSNSNFFPLKNITIEQGSFDDPLPQKQYSAMVAIESLAFSHNVTKTLINLARSLKSEGTLIVVEDVVAPWAVADGKNDGSSSEGDYIRKIMDLSGKPSLLTHGNWLESFAAAGLTQSRPPRDLMLEFDVLSFDTSYSATATAVTGLPFIGYLMVEQPWYSTGHNLLKSLIKWFRGNHSDDGVEEDDGNLQFRALHLMEDMMENNYGNAIRRAAHDRADLGYYMYVYKKQ